MNSLLEKEGLAGCIQSIFMDPPYGIKYNSNFQPFVNQTKVSASQDKDLPRQIESIKAYRDAWERDIHSYLNFLRDRLKLIKELLNESGSCFVQINDTNQHYVRNLMDEIFHPENFVSMIVYQTAPQSRTKLLPSLCDYIIWYAKDKKQVKYRSLYEEYPLENRKKSTRNQYKLELPDNKYRALTSDEKQNLTKIDKNKLFLPSTLISPGSKKFNFEFNGKTYNQSWSTNCIGMQRLRDADRIMTSPGSNNLYFKKYYMDFGGYIKLNNIWTDSSNAKKEFVVQTSPKAVSRCIQMTTDPGDLILDPTCGSGVTAYAAEKFGRRWITIDTSKIAIQLARQKLITASFDWYQLAHTDRGISAGFLYQQKPRITFKSLTNNEPPEMIALYDQPKVNFGITRIAGPFTVESISAPTIKALQDYPEESSNIVDDSLIRSGETNRLSDLLSQLENDGVTIYSSAAKIEFIRVELLSTTTHIHAKAETRDHQQVLIYFGNEDVPITPNIVDLVLDEAEKLKPTSNIILFAGFQYDPQAAKNIDEIKWPKVKILRTIMDPDLLVDDLKKSQKKTSNQSFSLVGQPDIHLSQKEDKYAIEVRGFDYYDPIKDEVESGKGADIAMWMLDTNYNGRSLLPSQIFFPIPPGKDLWQKLVKILKVKLNPDLIDQYVGLKSYPFKAGKYNRCAVKIIDRRGLESLSVKDLKTRN